MDIPTLRQPSAGEWSKGATALTGGDAEPIGKVLRQLAMPMSFIELFATALAEAAELQDTITADAADELAQLEREQKHLKWCRPVTQEGASAVAERLGQLEKAIPPASVRASKAACARRWLAALHIVLPELFGTGTDAQRLPSGMQLAPKTQAVMNKLGVDYYRRPWREFTDASTPIPKPARRKVYAAGAQQAVEQ